MTEKEGVTNHTDEYIALTVRGGHCYNASALKGKITTRNEVR